MHWYNENTIGNLRIDYLHRMQRVYESEIARMQDTIENSNNAREVTAADCIYVADKKDSDAQKRNFRLGFNFKNKQYDKTKKYYLVAYDERTIWRFCVIVWL